MHAYIASIRWRHAFVHEPLHVSPCLTPTPCIPDACLRKGPENIPKRASDMHFVTCFSCDFTMFSFVALCFTFTQLYALPVLETLAPIPDAV